MIASLDQLNTYVPIKAFRLTPHTEVQCNATYLRKWCLILDFLAGIRLTSRSPSGPPAAPHARGGRLKHGNLRRSKILLATTLPAIRSWAWQVTPADERWPW